MHMIIGMDSIVFVRDARKAVARALAFSSSVAATMPRTFFWFGQISTQTFEQHDRAQPRADADDHEVRIPRLLQEAERECTDQVTATGRSPEQIQRSGKPGQTCGHSEPEQRERCDVLADAGAAGASLVAAAMASAGTCTKLK
jgi:hypothetical protein